MKSRGYYTLADSDFQTSSLPVTVMENEYCTPGKYKFIWPRVQCTFSVTVYSICMFIRLDETILDLIHKQIWSC